jgi:hypothetical protein
VNLAPVHKGRGFQPISTRKEHNMGKILCLGVEAVVSCTIGAAIGGAIRPRTPVGVVCTAIGTFAVNFVAAPYIHDATVRALSPYVDVTK